MIQLLAEMLLTIAASAIAFVFVGTVVYVAILVLVFFVVLGIVYSRHGFLENDESAPTWAWLGVTTLVSVVFGMFWPMLPLVFAWRDVISGRRNAPRVDPDEPRDA